MCARMRCCWVESVSGGKKKDKCSLKIAPGQLVYTVYQQSVPGAKQGGREMERKMVSEKETADGWKKEKCGKIGWDMSGMQRENDRVENLMCTCEYKTQGRKNSGSNSGKEKN